MIPTCCRLVDTNMRKPQARPPMSKSFGRSFGMALFFALSVCLLLIRFSRKTQGMSTTPQERAHCIESKRTYIVHPALCATKATPQIMLQQTAAENSSMILQTFSFVLLHFEYKKGATALYTATPFLSFRFYAFSRVL